MDKKLIPTWTSPLCTCFKIDPDIMRAIREKREKHEAILKRQKGGQNELH